MRYDSPTPSRTTQAQGRSPSLAREKNTERALARKRTREQARAEYLAATAAEDEEADKSDSFNDPGEPQPPAARPSLFKMPNIREDLAALPGIFRSKPILFLPLVLLLIGLGIFSVLPTLSPDIQAIAGYYIQFFFAPPALFTFFVAGFFAPRASYLVGFVYGLIAGTIWSIAVLTVGLTAMEPGTPAAPSSFDPTFVVLNMYVIGVLYGTLAAALAAWYRDFLRGIQERSRARRVDREAQERAKRREERQEARRVAKQRT